jgi:hypothetical protein
MSSDPGASGSVGLLINWARKRRTISCSVSGADDDGGAVAASHLRLGEGQEDRLVATRRGGMNTRTSVVSE